jgi:hypothetical protein
MVLTFLQDRDLPRRGREAREWLADDERRRVISLVVLSVAISITVSLMATAIVGLVSRRRAGPAAGAEPPAAVGETPGTPELVGVPVMDAAATPAECAEAAPA